ncbi:MAG: hypothetical protein IJP48_07710 [Synergistaceae bacterium]|nr:hypothetical protein [Synergistaceae bacterium]
MIEIKPCRYCGSYPSVKVEYGGMLFSMYCPYCGKGSQLMAKNIEESRYNKVFNEIINVWNKEQEA